MEKRGDREAVGGGGRVAERSAEREDEVRLGFRAKQRLEAVRPQLTAEMHLSRICSNGFFFFASSRSERLRMLCFPAVPCIPKL